MDKYCIYEWIRLDYNEPFYVGKGNRYYSIDRGNKHFKGIINKMGGSYNEICQD
ncbi:MAG: hypothetical protein Q4Q02_06640 [Clostridium sp.]|uniref:hypothetical protein n=1 Tax=Clostridium sp. TaxID=1506 RepID=UPI0025C40F9F|nr:hypothetical protein [Clostridium sp.]MBS4957364.1 hypothetical protein [Clostridium sp.]MDO5780189.1 hypothetical protein [Clostridium sp.]